MWPMQAANSPSDYATTAGNVIPITYYVKTGVDLKSAQTTTSQKSLNLSPLSIGETLLLCWSPALTVWNQWMCMLVSQATHIFRALEVLTTPITCSPIRAKQAFMGLDKSE